MAAEVTPFRLAIPEADLAVLRTRLRQTRWPEPEPVADWSQGVPLSWLQDLCRYWAGDYDWRGGEGGANALPLAQTTIAGLPIVFAHVRSPHPGALPLVLLRAFFALVRWPASLLSRGPGGGR